MGGDSLSSGSSIESSKDMTTGTETEMLRIPGAQLFLLDGEESVLMGAGDFALIMMVQANSPLATLVAQVAEFQWPVGKDGPVLKIANFRYTFCIPGLLYGLILPDRTPPELVLQLESHMRKYCTYEVRPEMSQAAGVTHLRLWSSAANSMIDSADEGVLYWTAVADDVENYSVKLARKISSGSTAAANSILKGSEWASWGIKQGGAYVKKGINPNLEKGEMSPRMRKRVQQARRMSAVAKLLSRTVLKGAISATGHVASFLGTAISSTPPMRQFLSSDVRREVAVASVDAFAKVVEAVETAGKSLAMTTGSVGADIVQYRYGEQVGLVAQDGMDAMGNVIDSVWTLNKVGLRMLWHATAATAFGANRNNGSSSLSPTPRSPLKSLELRASDPTISQTVQHLESRAGHSSNSMSRHLSLGQLQNASASPPPSPQEEVLQTAQFFPSTGPVRAATKAHPTAPTSAFMSQHAMPIPATYAAYYPPNPNTGFQLYTRPGGPPQVQAFFPYGMDVSKSQ